MPAAAPACWLSNHADRVLAATNAIVVCRRAEDRRHAIFERRFEPMTIKISVLKETKDGEKRVAMVPAVAPRLAKLGATLSLQAGAGEAATLRGQRLCQGDDRRRSRKARRRCRHRACRALARYRDGVAGLVAGDPFDPKTTLARRAAPTKSRTRSARR